MAATAITDVITATEELRQVAPETGSAVCCFTQATYLSIQP